MHACTWFTSIDDPVCGVAAPHRITVTTALYRATVWFCTEHKLVQEANFARRAARIPGARRPSLTEAVES